MDRKELEMILKEGEGYKIEFKEGFNNLDKEIVAFANSSGGRIFLGVTDEGKIKGIGISNELKSRIQDIANNCRPKIKISIDIFEKIFIINVREGEDKPYECSAGFYKRIGSNSQKMTRDEIIDFFKSEGKIRFDELIVPEFSFPKDFDENKLLKFLELAGLTKSVKTETILINLGVAKKQEGKLYFNNTGVLFFAKEPQRFIPWSVFTVALFKDYGGADIIDRKEVEGSLFEIVEEVMKFVRLYSKVAYRFTGMPQRENIYEYPFEAIREVVINSVMHKYYFEHGHNNILKFFPDRIRIENYWQEPHNFILGETVFRRNHIIADLFARIHFGEKMGSGLERIKEICNKENAPFPEIKFNENYFYVTFRQSEEYLEMAQEEKVKEALAVVLTERQERAIEYLRENVFITTRVYANLVDVSERQARYDLNDLVEKNLIIAEGATTARKYRLRQTSADFGKLRSKREEK
ncbi:MAG: putative DNA binding domain-containing protein [Candidatus Methanoperedens sp.]|nr:putative DNA binding domain-containing protein [Candidatus Methanoperedens sp.]